MLIFTVAYIRHIICIICCLLQNIINSFSETVIEIMADEREAIIQVYFEMGLQYKDIVRALAIYHDLVISERHLKRILKGMGLFRRKGYCSITDLVNFIGRQLQESGKQHGYRWMAQKCQVNGIKCTQEEVRITLSVLDPEGSQQRKGRRLLRRTYIAKGPNFIWHFDAYDKIKRFGFCISGCIDGFSRSMIWLNCYTTSSNPKVIGGYFVEAVSSLGGCPLTMRGDRGTENVCVRQFQMFLRRGGDDNRAGERSYLEGPSTANQRIEYFWNFLRRQCTDYWICHFRDIEAEGNFDGGFIDINLLQYCYMHLVQVGYISKIVFIHLLFYSIIHFLSLRIFLSIIHMHDAVGSIPSQASPLLSNKY